MMVSLRCMKTITNVVRNFSLSCYMRESTSTKIDSHQIEKSINNETSPCSNSNRYSFEECQARVREIKRDGEIDFEIDGPIRSTWNRFPDDFDSTINKLDGFKNKHRTQQKQVRKPEIYHSDIRKQSVKGFDILPIEHITYSHVYLPGEIAIFRHYSLGKRKRPVLILSSSNHNQFPNATLLIVPFTTKYPNPALYQWKIFPEETCHRSVVEKNSVLIFDYSSLVEHEELEATLDSLKSNPFMATVKWWKQIVNGILP